MTAVGEWDDRRSVTLMSGVANVLTVCVVLLVLCVSNLMLAAAGVNYEGIGGAAWQKIHPASYVAILTLIALLFSHGNPFTFIDDVARRQLGALIFLAGVLGLMGFIMIRTKGPVSQLLDTFITPWILFIALTRQSERVLGGLATFLHLFMAANALLGLAEFLGGFRVTPLIAEGIVLTGDWRSSALLGHPLFNAAAAAQYALLILIGGARELPGWLKVSGVILQILSMAVFGGRAATAFFFLFAIPLLCVSIWRNRANLTITPAGAGAATLALFSGVLLLIVAFSAGFFDKFFLRFLQDDGSAATRERMFDLLWALPAENIWLGSDPELISTLQRIHGIPFGIENFWLAMIAFYGVLVSVPFFLMFGAFLNEFRRALVPGTVWAIVMFLLTITSSMSLASKTAMLSFFTILACILLRPVVRRG